MHMLEIAYPQALEYCFTTGLANNPHHHDCGDPNAKPSLSSRRYFFDNAALNTSTAQAWIDNAFNAETAQVAGYVAAGGLPLVISEWTLAGARAHWATHCHPGCPL